MQVFKNKFKLCLAIFFFMVLFGCQNSEPETMEVQEENQLKPDSQLAILMQSIALKDGSIDNIIDNANCISILLPVNVVVNSSTVTIQNEADYQLVENILESSDADIVSLQFPITIILSNYMHEIVNSEEELETFAEQCNDENQPDDDIECLDFKYPLEFKVTVIGESIPSTFDITNDNELFDFFENIEERAIINLTFPVTLIDSDNEEMIVEDLVSLEDLIEDLMDDCDEDDDYDYNDDDDLILANFITNGNWIIDEYIDMGEGLTENYEDYTFSFQADGTILANNGQQIVSGTWSIDASNTESLRFILNFEEITPFDVLNQSWLVEEIESGLTALRVGSQSTDDLRILVFEKV